MIVKFMYYDREKDHELFEEMIFHCTHFSKVKSADGEITWFNIFNNEICLKQIALKDYSLKEPYDVDIYQMNDDGKTIDHYIYS